jgi:hypothetical protein
MSATLSSVVVSLVDDRNQSVEIGDVGIIKNSSVSGKDIFIIRTKKTIVRACPEFCVNVG